MDIDNTHSIAEDEAVVSDETVLETPGIDASMNGDFHEDDGFVLDMEKVIVTVALFVITFVVLSPRGSLRHAWRIWQARRLAKKKLEEPRKEQVQVVPGSSPKSSMEDVASLVPGAMLTSGTPSPALGAKSTVTSSLCTGMVLPPPPPVEELTDEAKFLELWPTIRMSKYRHLVLPPECKVVDKPKKLKSIIKKQEEAAKKEKKKTSDSTEDNPDRRLVIYLKQFLFLLKSIYSYDYEGAARTVISWLQTWIRYRRFKPKPEEDEEEDEDDDASAAGAATPQVVEGNLGAAVSPLKNPVVVNKGLSRSFSTPAPLLDGLLVEEKKEALGESDSSLPEINHKRSSSFGSIYEMPLNDLGESDAGERPAAAGHSPVSPPRLPVLGAAESHARKRNALESYRHGLPSLTERSRSGSVASSSPLARRPIVDPSHQNTIEPDEGFTSPEVMPARSSPQPLDRRTSEDRYFFDAAYSKDGIKKMSREVGLPDKNGYILGDEFIESKNTPLLVFVNSRSGPQQGHVLITQLRRLLNPIQVWDLADGGPEKVLESFSVMSKFRILVCGGDGTVSWIISALENMGMDRWPPIAILPLGTGNDLARIHGWGGGYNNESLILILEQISDAYISLLDRWEMTVTNKKGKVKNVKSFTNYVGVGADAQAALQVHMLRENKPQLFFSRAVNKAWYAVFGAEDILKASCAHIPEEITLVADGVEVPLPPDCQGIILLNIDSYAGGIPLWTHGIKAERGFGPYNVNYTTETEWQAVPRRSQSLGSLHALASSRLNTLERVDSMDDLSASLLTDEEKMTRVMGCDFPSSCQDGMLDIVSIRGAFHLGQIRVGLSNAERLCQCREAKITIRKKVAVQVDGEPWRQNSCTLHVKRKKDPAYMLHRSSDESGGVETEMAKLLDWAEERGHIDRNVHSTLMKEFSRRIENKARQRRFRSQENVMLSLKRAIANTSTPSFQTNSSYSNHLSF